ncbi:hypothetical protein [Streptomyces sp. WMMC897]|uniref:hypothetical protein n=1 Tax=Streptomyces sp. WMMC897 TaxID=3014782 RepID=UPI0022B658D1|nr:hypothetical protein [Streptomyces sp. WMMC897]MCZ7415789.1 hypothetical protein [Streptomyces sp. WMMC897]
MPGRSVFEVEQYGPSRLWDEAEAACRWWESRDRPGRDRFGRSVDRDAQRVWLDEPGQPVPLLG